MDSFVQSGMYSGLKVKTRRMNFQEPEYLLNEPWVGDGYGMLTLAAMFALALFAVEVLTHRSALFS